MIAFFRRTSPTSIIISVVGAVEVRSALRRRQQQRDLDLGDADQAIIKLVLIMSFLRRQSFTPSLLSEAENMVDRYTLRALDAIQLASALVLKEESGPGQTRFIASDQKRLRAAAAEGFMVWNPEEGPCNI